MALKLNKSLDDLKPFYQMYFFYYISLSENWYDNEQALRELSDDEFAKLKIPVRLVNAIK